MHVVVTGSSGRLGRSVVAGLLEHGHRVTGLDRAPAGPGLAVDAPAISVTATAPAPATSAPATSAPTHTEHHLDLRDAPALDALLADLRPDAIVHLAAIAVPFSAPELEILTTNTALAYTVCAAADHAGVPRTLVASSPTVLGYSHPAWHPRTLPLDEAHPVEPSHAYALSKAVLEEEVRMFARTSPHVFGSFRPCYVISPEEWAGAPTQQGHTVLDRLRDPALAAVSLFNYVDARDAADFVHAWLAADPASIDGECFFVGAADALAVEPVAALWREHAPALGEAADALGPGAPVFSIAKAERMLGWRPTRTWRTELPTWPEALAPETDLAPDTAPAADADPAPDTAPAADAGPTTDTGPVADTTPMTDQRAARP
ncbi:NAD-dependent epimerase/dehydratase family protein [Herbiconiux gentiana]|nr:NAD(P)-dependent oxidoreductase [Herbiconiux gentiana]